MSRAAENTAYLPENPLVSGIPAMASRNSENGSATHGERRPIPAHCDRCVASPPTPLSSVVVRTSVTSVNAPIVANP